MRVSGGRGWFIQPVAVRGRLGDPLAWCGDCPPAGLGGAGARNEHTGEARAGGPAGASPFLGTGTSVPGGQECRASSWTVACPSTPWRRRRATVRLSRGWLSGNGKARRPAARTSGSPVDDRVPVTVGGNPEGRESQFSFLQIASSGSSGNIIAVSSPPASSASSFHSRPERPWTNGSAAGSPVKDGRAVRFDLDEILTLTRREEPALPNRSPNAV